MPQELTMPTYQYLVIAIKNLKMKVSLCHSYFSHLKYTEVITSSAIRCFKMPLNGVNILKNTRFKKGH